jgi:long-chain acyl-CoA synthetase
LHWHGRCCVRIVVNVASHVEKVALWSPERPAIVFEGRTISYGELERNARVTAAALVHSRVQRGHRVAILLPNRPELVMALLAVQKLGAVALTIGASLDLAEATARLRAARVVALFTTEALLERVAPACQQLPGLRQVILCDGQAGGALSLPELLATGPDDPFATEAMAIGDPAAILYTAGTGGAARPVVLTHGNLISNYLAAMRCLDPGPGDRHLLHLPLEHAFGQCLVMNTCFASAGTIILQREYQRQAVLAAVQEARVTHVYGRPAAYQDLLEGGIEAGALASVRHFLSLGAGLPPAVADAWLSRAGSPVHEAYGTTETAPLAAFNHPTAPRPGSLGTPVEGVQMRVVDRGGSPLAAGEAGEICIKGPNVMAGYLGRPEQTLAVVRGGWFHTGDRGHRDRDGYYFLARD